MIGVLNCCTSTPTNPAWNMYVEKNERKTMIRENTKQTSWITKTTRRITLSKRRYSQNVLIRRSTINNEICTSSTDLYLLSDNFIIVFYVTILSFLSILVLQYTFTSSIHNTMKILIHKLHQFVEIVTPP